MDSSKEQSRLTDNIPEEAETSDLMDRGFKTIVKNAQRAEDRYNRIMTLWRNENINEEIIIQRNKRNLEVDFLKVE